MGKLIRMGLAGAGGISHLHVSGINESPDLELTALCDNRPEALAEKGGKYGVPADRRFADYKKMMDSGLVDAVSICTPNDAHYEVAMAAIERGMPFAVEKPVCNSEREVAELLAAAKSKGIPNMVCFTYRFKGAARYAREIIRTGLLGELYHIHAEYLQSWGMSGENGLVPLVWRFEKKHAGSGALGDLGCHMIDFIRFISGKEFECVNADSDTFIKERPLLDGSGTSTVDVDDYILLHGRLSGGTAVQMNISRFAYSRGNYQRIEVYGEQGAIRYNLEEEDTLEVNMGNKPMREGHVWTRVPVPERHRSSQMQSFADIVNGKADGLAATLEDGTINQHVVDGAILSAREGRRVNL